MKIQNTKKSKKPLFVVLLVALLTVAIYAFVAYSYNLWPWHKSVAANTSGVSTQSQIDQQKDTFAQKESDSTPKSDTSAGSPASTNTTPSTTQAKKASVVITYAAQDDDGTVDVNAYVPDYYKDGTCTLTFTKGSQTLTRSSPAYRDATTTICTNPLIKSSNFPEKGTWSLVVSYAAEGGAGASNAQDITLR